MEKVEKKASKYFLDMQYGLLCHLSSRMSSTMIDVNLLKDTLAKLLKENGYEHLMYVDSEDLVSSELESLREENKKLKSIIGEKELFTSSLSRASANIKKLKHESSSLLEKARTYLWHYEGCPASDSYLVNECSCGCFDLDGEIKSYISKNETK